MCLGEGQKLTEGRKSVQDLETAGFNKDIEIETPSKVLESHVRSQRVCASVVLSLSLSRARARSLSLSLSLFRSFILSLSFFLSLSCSREGRRDWGIK